MKVKNIGKIGLCVLGGLLLLGVLGIMLKTSKSMDVTTAPELKDTVQLKTKEQISPDEVKKYSVEHNGKNLTRRYILELILNEKYPKTSEQRDKQLKVIKEEMKDDLPIYLEENQLTEETMMEEVRYDEQVHQLGKDSLDLSDKALKTYYNGWVPGMTIQHLLVSNESDIQEAENKLKEGIEFSDLIQSMSIDEITKKNDGKWENFKQGDSFSEFESVVFELTNVGDISKPFKTIMGWHMVKLVQTADKKPYKEVKESVLNDYINDKLTHNYLEKQLDNLLEKEIVHMTEETKKALGL